MSKQLNFASSRDWNRKPQFQQFYQNNEVSSLTVVSSLKHILKWNQ